MAGFLSTPVTSQWDYTSLGDSPQNNSASGAELSSETELFWDFLQVLQEKCWLLGKKRLFHTMSSLDRWIPLPWEWDADVAHTIVTHCSGSAASWTKGAADLKSISPTTHTCSNYRVTRMRGLQSTEKSLGLEGGQCQNRRGNGGWNTEEREERSRAKQGNKAKLEQDGDKPSAAKAKELWEAIVLQPGSAEALRRRLCSQKS